MPLSFDGLIIKKEFVSLLRRDMNRRQEIMLFLMVAAFVATWMFPPWVKTSYDAGDYSHSYPPTPRSQNV